jgi:YtcA family
MKTEFARVAPSSSKKPPTVRRTRSRSVRVIGLLLLIGALIFVVRPVSHRSPTIDILGSYFPAWMICIVSGLTLTLVSRWIVRAIHLEAYASPAPLIYTSLTIIYTFVTWIVFYQN